MRPQQSFLHRATGRGSWSILLFVPLLIFAAPCSPSSATGVEVLPEGVEQLLPRGRIAAVMNPQFVPASMAKIPGDARVLGVVVEGEPRAYSLNLLNAHEVVNDEAGNTSFAAVW